MASVCVGVGLRQEPVAAICTLGFVAFIRFGMYQLLFVCFLFGHRFCPAICMTGIALIDLT